MVLILWDLNEHRSFPIIIDHKISIKKKKRENTIWVWIDEVNIEWGWHQIFSFGLFDWTLDFSETHWIFPLHISYPKTNWLSSLSIIQYFKSSLFSAGSYHFQFLVSVSGSRPSKNCRVAERHIYIGRLKAPSLAPYILLPSQIKLFHDLVFFCFSIFLIEPKLY